MTRSPVRTLRPLVVLVAGAVAATACAADGDGRLEFGVQRLALDIAFVDEDAAPPVEPEVVVRIVPAPPEALEPDFDFDTVRVTDPTAPPLPPPPPLVPCPEAPPEATVELVASPSVIDPPPAGTYVRDNSGTIEILGAGVPLVFPFPFLTAWEVSEPTEEPGVDVLGAATDSATRFTISKMLTPTFEIVETYEIGAEALLLVERVTTSNGVTTTLRPQPAVEFFSFGAEGDDWVSAGADTDNGFGILIQGVIEDREVIDVCGDLIDTFRIAYTEQVVNLATGETFGTDSSEPSTIFIAPQYGGLVVREDLHLTQRTEDEDGSPLVVNFDYVSTLTGIEPE